MPAKKAEPVSGSEPGSGAPVPPAKKRAGKKRASKRDNAFDVLQALYIRGLQQEREWAAYFDNPERVAEIDAELEKCGA